MTRCRWPRAQVFGVVFLAATGCLSSNHVSGGSSAVWRDLETKTADSHRSVLALSHALKEFSDARDNPNRRQELLGRIRSLDLVNFLDMAQIPWTSLRPQRSMPLLRYVEGAAELRIRARDLAEGLAPSAAFGKTHVVVAADCTTLSLAGTGSDGGYRCALVAPDPDLVSCSGTARDLDRALAALQAVLEDRPDNEGMVSLGSTVMRETFLVNPPESNGR